MCMHVRKLRNQSKIQSNVNILVCINVNILVVKGYLVLQAVAIGGN